MAIAPCHFAKWIWFFLCLNVHMYLVSNLGFYFFFNQAIFSNLSCSWHKTHEAHSSVDNLSQSECAAYLGVGRFAVRTCHPAEDPHCTGVFLKDWLFGRDPRRSSLWKVQPMGSTGQLHEGLCPVARTPCWSRATLVKRNISPHEGESAEETMCDEVTTTPALRAGRRGRIQVWSWAWEERKDGGEKVGFRIWVFSHYPSLILSCNTLN